MNTSERFFAPADVTAEAPADPARDAATETTAAPADAAPLQPQRLRALDVLAQCMLECASGG